MKKILKSVIWGLVLLVGILPYVAIIILEDLYNLGINKVAVTIYGMIFLGGISLLFCEGSSNK